MSHISHTYTYILQQPQGSSKTELQVGLWTACTVHCLLSMRTAFGVMLAPNQMRRDWSIHYRSPPFWADLYLKHWIAFWECHSFCLASPDSTQKEMWQSRREGRRRAGWAGSRHPSQGTRWHSDDWRHQECTGSSAQRGGATVPSCQKHQLSAQWEVIAWKIQLL